MTFVRPILFLWDGEAMQPAAPVFAKRCDEVFVIGQRYNLVEHEDRSDKTQGHQFAWIREAWQSLPERLAEQFPTPEHLRKRALIDCGFYDETIVDAGSNAAALRVAVIFKAIDDFAHVVVRGSLVVRRAAKSQSRRTMDRNEFAASKTAILDHIASLLEVDPATLARSRSA